MLHLATLRHLAGKHLHIHGLSENYWFVAVLWLLSAVVQQFPEGR